MFFHRAVATAAMGIWGEADVFSQHARTALLDYKLLSEVAEIRVHAESYCRRTH